MPDTSRTLTGTREMLLDKTTVTVTAPPNTMVHDEQVEDMSEALEEALRAAVEDVRARFPQFSYTIR